MQHLSFSYDFQIRISSKAESTTMMMIFASEQNAYAPANPDSGTENIYIFDDKLNYLYRSENVTKTISAGLTFSKDVWGFVTVSRYYSTVDGSHTANLSINSSKITTDTWADKPLLDNENNIKTIGAAATMFGARNYFHGFIYDVYIQNNDLWHTSARRLEVATTPTYYNQCVRLCEAKAYISDCKAYCSHCAITLNCWSE